MKPRCCATAATACPLSKCPSASCLAPRCRRRNAASSTAAHWRRGGFGSKAPNSWRGRVRRSGTRPGTQRKNCAAPYWLREACCIVSGSRLSLRSAGTRTSSPPRARQRMHPALHARFRVLDVLLGEEIFGLHLIDRIDRSQEVALITEGHCRIDAHAAFELRVRGGPLLVAGGHTLGRHESLAAAAGDRIENVGARIHARCEAPHDVVHGIRIDVLADRNDQPHALRAR